MNFKLLKGQPKKKKTVSHFKAKTFPCEKLMLLDVEQILSQCFFMRFLWHHQMNNLRNAIKKCSYSQTVLTSDPYCIFFFLYVLPPATPPRAQ